MTALLKHCISTRTQLNHGSSDFGIFTKKLFSQIMYCQLVSRSAHLLFISQKKNLNDNLEGMSTLLRETSRLIGDFSREYSMINLKLTISKQYCYCHIHRVSILKTYKHVYKLSNPRYEIYMHTLLQL